MGLEIWIVLLVVASAVSGWVGYFWASRQAPKREELDALAAELDEARQKAATVQAGVSEHFEQSARLFGKLAGDYREFLEHFAGSAQALGLSESRTRELVAQSFQPLLTHEVEDLVVSAEVPESARAASPEQDASGEETSGTPGAAAVAEETTHSESPEPDATLAEPSRARVAEVELPPTAGEASGNAEASGGAGGGSGQAEASDENTDDEQGEARPAGAAVSPVAADVSTPDTDERPAGAEAEAAGERQRASS